LAGELFYRIKIFPHAGHISHCLLAAHDAQPGDVGNGRFDGIDGRFTSADVTALFGDVFAEAGSEII